MPVVPQYNNLQVQARPLPEVAADPRTAQHAMSGIDDAGIEQQKAGQAISGLGDELTKEAIQNKIEVNSADAKTADVQFTTQMMQKLADWKTNNNGLNAQKSLPDITQDLQDTYNDNLQQLQDNNPGAVKMFSAQAQARMGEAQVQIGQHVATQTALGIRGAALDRAKTEIDVGLNSKSDPIAYNGAMQTGLNEVEAVAKKDYGDDNVDMINHAKLNYTTQMNTAAIKQFIVEGNASAANDFMKTHWNEIEPEQRAGVEQQVKSFNDATISNTAAHDTFAKYAPDISSKESVPIYDMEQDIHSQFANNPQQEKLALEALHQQYSGFMTQRQGMATDASAKVANLIIGNPNMTTSAMRTTPEFLDLQSADPKAAEGMLEHQESVLATEANRQAAIASRDLSNENRNVTALAKQQQLKEIQGFSTYAALSNPDTIQNMSENDILSKLPQLGNDLTNRLLTEKRQFEKSSDKVVSANFDNEQFKQIVSSVIPQIYNSPNNQTQEQKANIGLLQVAVKDAIDAAQTNGKPLGFTEKGKLMQQIIDDKVMTGGTSLFGLQLTSPVSTPAALVKPDQMSKTFVNVGTEKVPLSSIPQDFYSQALKQRPNASSADVAKAWVNSRNSWNQGNQ